MAKCLPFMNTVYLAGIQIDEPIVTLTDLLVSVLCLIFFVRLHRDHESNKTFTFFKYYFLIMGLATAFGGLVGHAFFYALSQEWKLIGWVLSMVSIMLLERGAIEHTKLLFPPKVIQVLRGINLVEFATFLFLTFYFLDFFFVEFHSGYGLMFVVLSLEGYLYYRTRHISSGYMLIGVAFAAVAALVFMNEWSLHQWFNHLSLSHTLMAVAAVCFYLGVDRIDMSAPAVEAHEEYRQAA